MAGYIYSGIFLWQYGKSYVKVGFLQYSHHLRSFTHRYPTRMEHFVRRDTYTRKLQEVDTWRMHFDRAISLRISPKRRTFKIRPKITKLPFKNKRVKLI